MAIEIIPYREDLVEPVRAFNGRLRMHGCDYQFPDRHLSARLPKLAGRVPYEEGFLAVETGTVRGGYLIKRERFWVNGEPRSVGQLRLPLSEGIVDRTYLKVGPQLFQDAMRREPALYGLGIGGMAEPLLRMMKAFGWQAQLVPFFFRVVHPTRFLRQIRYLRTSSLRRGLLDGLAASGLGWLAINAAQAAFRRPGRSGTGLTVDVAPDFAAWCEPLWQGCRDEYALIGARDLPTLEILYPRSDRVVRLRVSREGRVIGWALLLATAMSGHRQFGGMRVGSIVDCLARARDAETVIRAATEYLEGAGVDLIVTNQAAAPWGLPLRRSGYLRGPSNFVFAASRGLLGLIQPFPASFRRMHITRGDGDGPTNL